MTHVPGRDGLRGHDSLDQAGMVGGGHDGDFPQQHLGGLAVQHGFVYDLDGHAFWKQREFVYCTHIQIPYI